MRSLIFYLSNSLISSDSHRKPPIPADTIDRGQTDRSASKMQIQMNNIMSLSPSTNLPQLSIGDLLNVTIKGKLNQSDALVSFNGATLKVRFDGDVPKENNPSIEITGVTEEGILTVKVSDKKALQVPIQQNNGSDEKMTEIIKSFTDNGVPITKENVAAIKDFLKNDKYSMDQKMETLQVMVKKQIAVSSHTLVAVAEALNGDSFTESLVSVLDSIKFVKPSNLDGIIDEVQSEPDADKVLKLFESFVKNASIPEKVILEKIIIDMKNSIEQDDSSKEQLVQKLTSLKEEPATLHTSEAEITKGEQIPPSTGTLTSAEQNVINEAIQGLNTSSQNIMVTTVTKKMSQMTIDFRNLKQDISKNLDNITKVLEKQIAPSQANVKQILESTIHKLDNAILKGDFLLFTDMATEKKLLLASSQLAEAKKLLAKGEIVEANKRVLEVKGTIENLVFKPSDVKIKHYVSERFGSEITPARQAGKLMDQVTQPFSNGEASSRQMFEAFRKLGLTHESEVGRSLLSKSENSANQQQSENVKRLLLRLLNQEDMKPQQKQQVEQAVTNISGQQLLTKQDSSGQQNQFFQLPYMLDNQVENIKIYVNSKKEGDKVDWENCSIYFVLETKKLGEIGVLLSASERNVNLTFKSNKDQVEEKVNGFEDMVKERFKEIGYKLNGILVKPLNEVQEEDTATTRVDSEKPKETVHNTDKRYDITI